MNLLLFIHLAARITASAFAGLLLTKQRTPSTFGLFGLSAAAALHAAWRLVQVVSNAQPVVGDALALEPLLPDVLVTLLLGLAVHIAVRARTAGARRIRAMQVASERAMDAQHAGSCRRMAEGMGHRVGTMLAALHGAVDLLEDRLRFGPTGEPIGAELDQVKRALQEVQRVSDELQLMGGSKTFEPRQIDVGDIVSAVAQRLSHSLEDGGLGETAAAQPAQGRTSSPRRGVRVDISSSDRVVVDAKRFTRVLWRLLSNAVAATAENQGVIELSVSAMTVKPGDSGRLPVGRWVCVDVRDSGAGMSKADRRRALEPFYSTTGGRGLGLPVVQAFAEQCGGRFELHSRLGGGTTARLLLPAASTKQEPQGPHLTVVGSPPLRHSRPQVLLAEDTEAVRLVVCEMLKRVGCDVRLASDGQEALHIATAQEFAFDLVLSDVEMPRLGGPDLHAALAQHAPELRFVLMTAHPTESFAPGFLPRDVPVLRKPFGLTELAGTIAALGVGMTA